MLARSAGCALLIPPDPRRRTLTRAAPRRLLARFARSGRALRGEAAQGNQKLPELLVLTGGSPLSCLVAGV